MLDKIEVIQSAPKPHNVSALKAYLGLLSYYSRFLPHLPTVLSPLYKLLNKGQKWLWSVDQEKAFSESKMLLTSDKVLTHFNSELPLLLACDASQYGVGAVLSHRMQDGLERPIAFVSRTLTSSEKNYSQIEKESLACIFGVKRFHAYLFGHSFQLITDHKPLITLFNENKPIPMHVSPRILRWALTLAAYEYTISFKSTSHHCNADGLSRVPLQTAQNSNSPLPPEFVLLIDYISESPLNWKQIAKWSIKTPQLSQVMDWVRHGWPQSDSCASNQDLHPKS